MKMKDIYEEAVKLSKFNVRVQPNQLKVHSM
jgi:hypothetical protein